MEGARPARPEGLFYSKAWFNIPAFLMPLSGSGS
jgi:hypothetical protein